LRLGNGTGLLTDLGISKDVSEQHIRAMLTTV
jgi:hypothetical protein